MNKKRFFSTLVLLTLVLLVFAKKEIKYVVDEIPPELTSNAKAVVRFEKREFELKSDNKAIEKISFAITILNENGHPLAYFNENYNKYIQINNISATVYSANGEKLHRIKQDDILDISATSDASVYDDNRMKVFEPETKDYPFTIEYSFEREYKGIFYLPTWYLFKGYNVSVEKAEFILKTPDPESIRVKQRNLDTKPIISTEGNLQVQTWKLTNYKARKREPFSQNIANYTPNIQLAPSFINIQGNKGAFKSWKDYCSFINDLNADRDELPEETINLVAELTKNAKSEFEKVKLLYEYLQNKTRYVSVQVGLGGWQTSEAEEVDRLGYGDCKALSNYMKSLLKAAGINSIYTLVNAGSGATKMDKDFPSNQFNHVILCVPFENDTLWLECTSQQIPCGYLSTFTDDRDVLLIDENGGKIVHSKTYDLKENMQERSIHVEMDEAGNAWAEVNTVYKGIQYDNISPILQLDQKDQRKYLLNHIDIPNFSLVDFSHQANKSEIPHIDEVLNLQLRNYASSIGSRLVLPLNVMNKYARNLPYLRHRESDILVRRPFIDRDSITFEIPSGYSVEKVPDPISFSSAYGEYSSSVVVEENKIIYHRELQLKKGEYPAESYHDFRKFFEQISDADEMKCLLINN